MSAVLWRNLQAVFDNHLDNGGTDTREFTKNAARLAEKAGIGFATLDRLKHQQNKEFRSSVLVKLAGALDVPPWQLMYPGFDPARPPQVLPYSGMAIEAAKALDSIQNPADKAQVYAMVQQMATFGQRLSALEVPAPEPAPAPPAKTKLRRAR
jgi:transcriptional regulator with XRE-family HTH domain